MEHATAVRLMEVVLKVALLGLLLVLPAQCMWIEIADGWERRDWCDKVPAFVLGAITALWSLLFAYRAYGYIAWGI